MYFILIENALKFALENTKVNVRFSETEDQTLKIETTNECYHIDIDEINLNTNKNFNKKSHNYD